MNAFRKAAVAAVVTAGAAAAQADTVNLTGLSFPGAPVTVTYNGLGPSGGPAYVHNFSAGGFSGTYVGSGSYGFMPGSISTFCAEIYASISPGSISGYAVVDPNTGYNTGSGANTWGSAAVAISARVDKLMAYALSTTPVFTALESAALQLALWNAIYDNDNLVDPGAGSFSVTDFGSATLNGALQSKADTYLLGGSTYAGATRHYFVATRDGTQDLLVIPEPTSLALVAIALAGITASRRKPALR